MTASEVYERAKYFFPPPPPPEYCGDNISDMPVGSGVYFIYHGQEIVYVGESINLRKRIATHERFKAGMTVSCIECDVSQRRRLEAFYVGLLNPIYNRESTTRCPVSYKSPSRTNLTRRLYGFIEKHPGCSLSVLRKAGGWRVGSVAVRRTLHRMCEWRFVREEVVETTGRSKTVYYCVAAETAGKEAT